MTTPDGTEAPFDRRRLMEAARHVDGIDREAAWRSLIGALLLVSAAIAIPAILGDAARPGAFFIVVGWAMGVGVATLSLSLLGVAELRARRIAARWAATGNPHQAAIDHLTGHVRELDAEISKLEQER